MEIKTCFVNTKFWNIEKLKNNFHGNKNFSVITKNKSICLLFLLSNLSVSEIFVKVGIIVIITRKLNANVYDHLKNVLNEQKL